MKKLISLTLTFLIAVSALFVFPIAANAKTSADGNWYYDFAEDGNVRINGYRGKESDLTLPKTIDGYKVTRLFRLMNSKVKILRIGKHIEKISPACKANLKKIIVDKKNKSYSSKNGVLFNKKGTKLVIYPACIKTKTPKIPKSVKVIGNSAFSGNHHIKKAVIPDTVKKIGEWAFSFCDEVKYVFIPKSVKYIGEQAFAYNESLENLEFDSDGVYSFGEEAFYRCDSLKTVELPKIKYYKEGIYRGVGLFRFCENLKKVKFSKNASFIPLWCFACCYKLKSVTIPKSVKKISNYAFACEDYGRNGIFADYSFLIKGKKNSAAHKYAKKYHLKFKEI